jgi:hypothetical protein
VASWRAECVASLAISALSCCETVDAIASCFASPACSTRSPAAQPDTQWLTSSSRLVQLDKHAGVTTPRRLSESMASWSSFFTLEMWLCTTAFQSRGRQRSQTSTRQRGRHAPASPHAFATAVDASAQSLGPDCTRGPVRHSTVSQQSRGYTQCDRLHLLTSAEATTAASARSDARVAEGRGGRCDAARSSAPKPSAR